jgi:hypothetical protein
MRGPLQSGVNLSGALEQQDLSQDAAASNSLEPAL